MAAGNTQKNILIETIHTGEFWKKVILCSNTEIKTFETSKKLTEGDTMSLDNRVMS